MAQPESKYTYSISVKLTKDDAQEPPMMDQIISWSGLPYAGTVAMNRVLVDALVETTAWGEEMADSIGQLEVLETMLEAGGRGRASKRKGGKK
jgi:hypothetical protein